jgi:hypothetical protein
MLLVLLLGGCGAATARIEGTAPAELPLPPGIEVAFNQGGTHRYRSPISGQWRQGDDLEALILDTIASARQEILVAVQELSLPRVATALVQAQGRGVRVRVVRLRLHGVRRRVLGLMGGGGELVRVQGPSKSYVTGSNGECIFSYVLLGGSSWTNDAKYKPVTTARLRGLASGGGAAVVFADDGTAFYLSSIYGRWTQLPLPTSTLYLSAGFAQNQTMFGATQPAKFADVASATRPWLLVATAAQVALLLGNLMLLVNFAQTVAALVPFRAAGNPVSRPALKAVLS